MDIYVAGTEVSVERKSFEIYVQGCNRHCKGCHNPETWDFHKGTLVNWEEYLTGIKKKLETFPFISDIYISGGDLLCLPAPVAEDASRIARDLFQNYTLWLFTGCQEEALPSWVYQYYDVIKCGPYREDLKQEGFPASSNQKILRINEGEYGNKKDK